MELTNEFRVGVPVATAWNVLTDVERIAPCMPGAELQEVEGDEYRGIVKVKVGPITAQYKGKATFVELDAAGHRAVLRAEGRDTRGAGNANATITATLAEDGDGTRVTVVTDLAVTGKVAQFGRGVLSDVSAKLLDQFVACLERDVLVAGADERAAPPEPAASEPETVVESGSASASAEAEPEPEPEPAAGVSAASEPAWSAAAPAPEPEVAAVVVEERVEAPSPNGSSPADSSTDSSPAPAPAPEIRRIESKPATPVDLLDAAGGSMAKRVGPAVGAVVFLLWVFTRRRRKRR